MMKSSRSPFPFGQRVTITPAAHDALLQAGESVERYIDRFAQCDWGEVSAGQRASNGAAESTGAPVVGVYATSTEASIQIETLADRSRTVIRLAGKI